MKFRSARLNGTITVDPLKREQSVRDGRDLSHKGCFQELGQLNPGG